MSVSNNQGRKRWWLLEVFFCSVVRLIRIMRLDLSIVITVLVQNSDYGNKICCNLSVHCAYLIK